MKTQVSFIPYQKTYKFSSLVNDYLNHSFKLQPYYNYSINIEAIEQAITQRRLFPFHRNILVETLLKQYKKIIHNEVSLLQIHSLERENTFTVCTAHQPNLLGGPLYTMYKIIHTIQLANDLKKRFPIYHFVPIYYVGSEDADKEELLHVYCKQQKIEFHTSQTGAVGRMSSKGLNSIFREIKMLLKGEPFTEEIIDVLTKSYSQDNTLAQGNTNIFHHLFADKGLLVIDGDDRVLKSCFAPIFNKELHTQFSEKILQQRTPFFSENYFIPTQGRNINLFYLEKNIRERIIKEKDNFYYIHQQQKHTLDIDNILEKNPEKLSPNVILRPLYQETILPNIAFVGGSGEVAYWLLLKKVFEAAGVHYPAIFLRNSFMMITQKEKNILLPYTKDEFGFFKSYDTLIEEHMSTQKIVPNFKEEIIQLEKVYKQLLQRHRTQNQYIALLQNHSIQGIQRLQKKVWREYRKEYNNEELKTVLSHIFPNCNLQERMDSMFEWYARYGKEIINIWMKHSKPFNQKFGIIYLEK
ncbi:MAG: bacillithiol biosynthesis cysteine-adding enzyme BshC [Chitinophagaceae bacterium]